MLPTEQMVSRTVVSRAVVSCAVFLSLIVTTCFSEEICGPKEYYAFNNTECRGCTVPDNPLKIIVIPCNKTADAVLSCVGGYEKCPTFAPGNDFICVERLSTPTPTLTPLTTMAPNHTVCPNMTSIAPETNTTMEEEEEDNQLGLKVGLSVGGTVGLISIIAICVVCCYCRRKRRNQEPEVRYNASGPQDQRKSISYGPVNGNKNEK